MKYIRYLLILLFPIIVSAKMSSIEVLDIKMEEKTGSVEIIEKETIMNSQINFNLKFYEVGDTVKYKVKIKNITGSDVGITVGESELKSKYLSYEAKLPDIKELKNNEEVELTLNIRFYNNLEKEDIKSGKYIEEQKININLVDGKLLISNNEISDDLDDNTSNPLTSDYLIVYALITSFLLLIIITRNNKKLHKMIKKTTKYSLLLILLIPVFSSAVNGIKIKSYIEVRLVKPNPCTYDGDLINNARYEKEQYEYYYNEELNGWRLSLINRESTTPVTSKICTEINGKPLVSMRGAFSNSKAESIDLSSFDTSNTIYMDGMFYNLENIKFLDFITFDTTKVENMTSMLSDIKKIENIDLSGFETPNLVKMTSMFANSNNIKKIDLSNFDTSHVTNMDGMLSNMYSLETLNLNNFDFRNYDTEELMNTILGRGSNIKHLFLDNTKYGTTLKNAFSNMINLEDISLKNVDTSNVTNMQGTFSNMKKLKKLDVSSLDTSNVTTMNGMFYNLTEIKELDLSNFDTSNVTNIEGMLGNMTSLEKVNLSNFDFRKASKSYLFGSVFGGTPKEKLKVINLSKSKYQGSLEYAFSNFVFVEEINMDNADVSKVTNMSNMFQSTSALTSLNMSKWDTSNVTDMNHMFYQASSIENIDVSDFNVEKVTNMDYMFSNMTKLKELNVTNFKTHSLKSLNDFASSNPRLTKLDLSSFDTSQLERMPWYLMYGDDNITEVNLSNWDMTSFDNNSHVMGRMLGGSSYSLAGGDYNIDYKVKKIIARNVKFPKDMYGMFAYIPTLEEIDLSNADTARTTSMRDLFLGAKKLKRIDLSSFDTSKVTNMNDMFTNTYALEEIDLSSFDISNVITASDMFQSTGATIGYAKNQEALEFFTSKAPSTLVFKIK